MKKILALFGIITLIGCNLPVSAHEVHRGNYRYSYAQPPRHEVVIHKDYRQPPRSGYYYHKHSKSGAIVGGIVGLALVAGITAAILD